MVDFLATLGDVNLAGLVDGSRIGWDSTANQWTVVNEPYLDPTSRGAKFDNVTDDTPALQQSLNDLAAAGSGKLLMPTGFAKFSQLVLPPKVTVEGMGSNITTLSRIPGSTGPAITDAHGVGATSIDLRSFTVECNSCVGNGIDLGNQSGGPDFNYWGTLRDVVVRDAVGIGYNLGADTVFGSNIGAYLCSQGMQIATFGGNVWNDLHIVGSTNEDLILSGNGGKQDRFFGLTIERLSAAPTRSIYIPAGGGWIQIFGLTFDVEAAITVANMIELAAGAGRFDMWGATINVPAGAAVTNLVTSDAWGVSTPGFTGARIAVLPEWHYHDTATDPGPIWFDSGQGLHRELIGTRWSVSETSGTQYSARGTATLAAGTVTVTNHLVTANSRIHLAAQDNNTTGALRVSARTAGTSFTVTSSNAGDTGLVAYEIVEPAAY